MTSRRLLKKRVNNITEELFTGCMIYGVYQVQENKEKVEELMNDIIETRDSFVSRINHTEPGNTKAFYKKFHADFNAKIKETIDAIGQLK